MKPIQDIKNELREKLPLGIDLTIAALKASIPADVPKYNDIILLDGRYRKWHEDMINDVLTSEEQRVEFNRIQQAILDFINALEEKDFVKQPEVSAAAAQAKKGKVLYRIPNRMQVQKEVKCLVRIAFNEEILYEDLQKETDDAIKDVRIAEVMGVELLDPNEQAAFNIRTLSSKIQSIDELAYAEWLFYVKPIMEGSFPLLLKVAVIEIIDGVERKREVVLEETVQVVAVEVPAEEQPLADSGYTLQTAGNIGGATPAAPGIGRETIRKASKAGVALLALGIAMAILAYLVYNPIQQSENLIGDGGRKGWDKIKNTEDSTVLKQFLEDNPEGEFADLALERLASLRFQMDAVQQGDSIILQMTEGNYPLQVAVLEDGETIYDVEVISGGTVALARPSALTTAASYSIKVVDAKGITRIVPIEFIATTDPNNLPAADTVVNIAAPVVNNQPNKKQPPASVKPNKKPDNANPNLVNPNKKSGAAKDDRNKTPQPTVNVDPAKTVVTEPTYSFKNVSRTPIYKTCNTKRLQQAEGERQRKLIEQARGCTEDAIRNYIRNELSRTPEVMNNKLTKTVQVQFVVDKNGRVQVETIEQNFDTDFKDKVRKVVESLPEFVPGQDAIGNKVAVRYSIPITFKAN
ncbi:MAG: energy transducer TonB [Saprospiraceae bacterium]